MFKFTHVSFPVVSHEKEQGVFAHTKDMFFKFPVVLLYEIFNQQPDIFGSLSQRRYVDAYGIEPVKEIFTYYFTFEKLLYVLVCGGDHAHIHVYRLGCAEGKDCFFLQNAKQLGLERHGHGIDLIEIDGSAVGFLKYAFLVFSACESSFPRTKEQTLQYVFRQGSAVESYKGLVFAVTGIVYGGNDEFFAGAGFAVDENRGLTVCYLHYRSLDFLHGLTAGDYVIYAVFSSVGKFFVGGGGIVLPFILFSI